MSQIRLKGRARIMAISSHRVCIIEVRVVIVGRMMIHKISYRLRRVRIRGLVRRIRLRIIRLVDIIMFHSMLQIDR